MNEEQLLNLHQNAQISMQEGAGIALQSKFKRSKKKRGAKRQLELPTSSNTTLHTDNKGKAASCSFKFSHQF